MKVVQIPEASIDADWQQDFKFFDGDDKQPIDLTVFSTIVLTLSPERRTSSGNWNNTNDYGSDYGYDSNYYYVLQFDLASGDLQIIAPGTLRVSVSNKRLGGLGTGNYSVGIIGTEPSGAKTQITIGHIYFYGGINGY